MSYPHIVHAVFHSPWAIQRAWLGTIFSLLHSRIFSDGAGAVDAAPGSTSPTLEQLRGELAVGGGAMRRGLVTLSRYGRAPSGALVNHTARIHAEALKRCGDSYVAYERITAEEEAALPAGQIAHIFASGVMGKHISAMEEACAGGLSVDRLQAALRTARDDDKVSAIMVHLDTPGGVVYGIPETAALVREVAAVKTVGAFCDSVTASAGYWSTCAADAFYLTPSAEVGSIGVYAAVIDYVGWCEKQGIKVDLIKDGAHKGAGFPGTALTTEQRDLIQAEVLECSAVFKADVRAARPGVSDDSLQGQTFTGRRAIEAGLAHTLVNDLDTALRDLALGAE